LNDSTQALSVGFLGCEKSSFTTFLLHPVQRPYYVFSLQALSRFDGHTLSGIDIDDRQGPKNVYRSAVIGNKI
jgi:hypothetical protein